MTHERVEASGSMVRVPTRTIPTGRCNMSHYFDNLTFGVWKIRVPSYGVGDLKIDISLGDDRTMVTSPTE